jgi:hypothetical protein
MESRGWEGGLAPALGLKLSSAYLTTLGGGKPTFPTLSFSKLSGSNSSLVVFAVLLR